MDKNLSTILEFLESQKKYYRAKLVQYLELQMTVRHGVAKLSILEKIREYNTLIEQNNLSIMHVKIMLEDLQMGKSLDEDCKRHKINSKKQRPISVPVKSSSKIVDRMMTLFNI